MHIQQRRCYPFLQLNCCTVLVVRHCMQVSTGSSVLLTCHYLRFDHFEGGANGSELMCGALEELAKGELRKLFTEVENAVADVHALEHVVGRLSGSGISSCLPSRRMAVPGNGSYSFGNSL
ncbi:hypothetical protein Vretimale_7226 [Volvox reticuliferus]|uniref:Uncharacterized protein n=1 Tax=Volvox reticuliferus TaxID=1737510 RepID=A0A8J4G8K2_9CHLO|nr:hypothetical protein Vretifemale_10273 [Volvox reticuliferus]GIM02347.1 hypothetical protein Vretimale_7226 [Volvox reticuliferus]